MVMIVANTACIACYSQPPSDDDDREAFREGQRWIEVVVQVFLTLFVAEMVLRLIANGPATRSWLTELRGRLERCLER